MSERSESRAEMVDRVPVDRELESRLTEWRELDWQTSQTFDALLAEIGRGEGPDADRVKVLQVQLEDLTDKQQELLTERRRAQNALFTSLNL